MHITAPITTQRKSHTELSVRVYTGRFPRLPQKIWWRFPSEYAEFIGLNGNPYIPAFLLICMLRNEPLSIEAPVSAKLLNTTAKIQSLYQRWFTQAREIEVCAQVLQGTAPPNAAVGCFFSCGVDSFHTLFKNQSTYKRDDQEAITHLIFSAGFDIKLKRKALLERVQAHLAQVAQEVKLPLLPVSTNLKSFSNQHVDWLYYPFLASLGLHLGPFFRQILISAGYSWEQLRYSGPNGCHPEMDPLWSTEQTLFIHDGCESSRLEKIVNWLSPSPLVPEHLHVCWRNKNIYYNCGVCEKCLRTMVPLYLGTGRTEFPCFSQPLIPENIRRIKLKGSSIHFVHENLQGLEKRHNEFDLQLKEALQFLVDQHERNRK